MFFPSNEFSMDFVVGFDDAQLQWQLQRRHRQQGDDDVNDWLSQERSFRLFPCHYASFQSFFPTDMAPNEFYDFFWINFKIFPAK